MSKTLAQVETEIRVQQDDEDICRCEDTDEGRYVCLACRHHRAWFLERERAKRKAERAKPDEPELPIPF